MPLLFPPARAYTPLGALKKAHERRRGRQAAFFTLSCASTHSCATRAPSTGRRCSASRGYTSLENEKKHMRELERNVRSSFAHTRYRFQLGGAERARGGGLSSLSWHPCLPPYPYLGMMSGAPRARGRRWGAPATALPSRAMPGINGTMKHATRGGVVMFAHTNSPVLEPCLFVEGNHGSRGGNPDMSAPLPFPVILSS